MGNPEVKSSTNLTSYQATITGSQKFKERFSDSVVKDVFGEPLAVRHGSAEKFANFQPNPQGIFFCEFGFACEYARSKFDLLHGGKKTSTHGIFLYECFLRIEKPYICNREKYRDIDVEKILGGAYDGIIAYKTRDSGGTYDQYAVKNPEQIMVINRYG